MPPKPQTTNETDHRLNRIEEKIDKLAEAIVSIARAEEKLVALEHDKNTLIILVTKVEERLTKVEKESHDNAERMSIIGRVFWLTLAAVITTLIGVIIVERWDGQSHDAHDILSPIPVLSSHTDQTQRPNSPITLDTGDQRIIDAIRDLDNKISTKSAPRITVPITPSPPTQKDQPDDNN